MVNVVVVDADGEVGRSGCGFAGVVAGGKGDEGKNGQCCCEYCLSVGCKETDGIAWVSLDSG